MHRLGSLDFLESQQLSFDDLLGASTEVTSGQGSKKVSNAFLSIFDLMADK